MPYEWIQEICKNLESICSLAWLVLPDRKHSCARYEWKEHFYRPRQENYRLTNYVSHVPGYSEENECIMKFLGRDVEVEK